MARKLTRLGEILVEMGACQPQHVLEGLDSQVVFGGRLGTNLLELGVVSEEALAGALARRYGVPCLHGELTPQPQALALLNPEQADRLEIVPYELSGRRLTLLCCDPSNLNQLDLLAFSLDKTVVPMVVPEARLWALLRTHYAAGRPVRGIEQQFTRLRSSTVAEPAPAEDLMDEEQFASLYESRLVTPPPVRSEFPGRDEVDLLARTSPSTRRGSVPRAGAGEGRSAVALEEGQPEGMAAGRQAELDRPLSFAEALGALSGVTDRAAIAHIVLRYARSYFRRVVLLAVHTRGLDGWEGLGQGLSPQRVARLHISLVEPGLLKTVVESRSHFLGPLLRSEANIRLLRALGGGVPKNAFAMPILARGKVVNVLYADDGRGRMVNPEGLGELLILAVRIAQTYDVLLERER